MNTLTRRLLQAATAIALLGVAIHVVAVPAGPGWYAWFDAPPFVVRSAQQGTWIAPVGALVIAALMGVCAWYGAAALGWVRRPWLHRTGLWAMAAVCLLRAALLPLLLPSYPGLLTAFGVISALVWGLAGAGFAAGAWALTTQPAAPGPAQPAEQPAAG